MWTAKYHEWRGSIAPPFSSQEVRSGPLTLASSWWKTQLSQSTASRSKMLTSMMKGPMSALSSQTRNQNPQKCISSFKVGYLPRRVSDCIQQITKGVKQDQCWNSVVWSCFAVWVFIFTDGQFVNSSCSCLDLTSASLQSNQMRNPSSSVLRGCD